MGIFMTRTVFVPAWLLVCAILAVWSSPQESLTTGLLIFMTGLAVLAILLGRNATHAPVTHRPPIIALKPVIPSWPNSGYRNVGRATKRG